MKMISRIGLLACALSLASLVACSDDDKDQTDGAGGEGGQANPVQDGAGGSQNEDEPPSVGGSPATGGASTGGDGGAGGAGGSTENVFIEACEKTATYAEEQVEASGDLCHFIGVLAAQMKLISGDEEEAVLQATCAEGEKLCIAEPESAANSISAFCDPDRFSTSCDTSVEEVQDCAFALVDAFRSAGETLPECGELAVEDLESQLYTAPAVACSKAASCLSN